MKKIYERYIKKSVEEDLKSTMVFIGGPRQAGKTTFALNFLPVPSEKHPAYLNWDDLGAKSSLLLIMVFLEGRIIITASSASEVSKESDDLKHGYFTYYLLKGLKGAADVDGDGFIDVNEISSYLNREVPEAIGQRQHPVKKGETEGQVVIGRVR